MKKSLEIELELTAIEGGLIHLLDRPINKVDQSTLVEGLQELKENLGTGDSERGHLLLAGIIEALADPDSFWQLKLSHRGQGEALSVQEIAKRFAKDASVALYIDLMVEEGLSRESASILAETEFGEKPSTIKAMAKRAKKRSSNNSI